jgi:hypothetical protein
VQIIVDQSWKTLTEESSSSEYDQEFESMKMEPESSSQKHSQYH